MADHLPRTVRRGYCDGAYDKNGCYQKFGRLGIELIAPPQRGAVLHDLKREPWMRNRNQAIKAIIGLGNDDEARKIWKRLTGYHQRSIAETAMHRFKALFGGQMMARDIRRQRAELYAKSVAINKMTRLGMPRGVWVS